ncbi:MAG: tetratricopeptide repeat protein [Planctomycetota bacterium]
MRPIPAWLFLAAAPALSAQDVIHWVDGTTTDRCRVSDFTVIEVKWQGGGGSDHKSSDQVVDLKVEKVLDRYKRGFDAKNNNAEDTPDLFLGVARQDLTKAPFMAQFGFWEAGKFLMEAGKAAEAFATFDELIQKLPDSGFVPRAYAMKLDYYLSSGKAKSADKLAKEYKELATTKGYPNGYLHEASFYGIMADAVAGTLKPNELRSQLQNLIAQTESSFPMVANRCRLQVADSWRREGKADEAMTMYERIAKEKVVDTTTLAGAMLGTGHIQFGKGTESDKEPYREAMLSFLHVYLDTPAASPDVVAEALYQASEAALKWGGTDHRMIAGRLRYMLRSDSRFGETEWAKK